MGKFGIGERAPWGDFPKVIRNGDLGTLKQQPEFRAAKSGDAEAALAMVLRLMSEQTVQEIQAFSLSRETRILPVLALEESGHNKIPLEAAEVLAYGTGLEVELGIIQRDKVARTGSGADHRLALNPAFDGPVERGRSYIIVDDTLTMGGTIASLRGYVENRGGRVAAAAVLSAHAGALELAVKPKMVQAINAKHGSGMNRFFEETFGYGIDKLTQGEAGHIRAGASIDSIRDRIFAARHEGIQRMDHERAGTTPSKFGL